MKPFIIIRSYTKKDEFQVQDVIKSHVMSGAQSAFFSCMFREITLQLIVLSAAIMFIFFGVPLVGCVVFGVPGVIIFLFVCIHASFYNKAMEAINIPGGTKQCWVAEAYEPYTIQLGSENVEYNVVGENSFETSDIEINKMRKKIVGTINVKNHASLHNTGWIYRLTVDSKYPFSPIAEALTYKVLKHCADQQLYSAETSTNECQEKTREVLTNIGFTMKQIYTKRIIASVRIMKAQMGIDLNEWKHDSIQQ